MSLKKSKKKLVVIAGPTAVGKTNISIKLAKQFVTEIISADSRQFYREMKIGTAAPSKEEMNEIQHHFIGNLSVKDEYSAGKFERDCLITLESIFREKDVVIMCGGSGLFIDAVTNGLDKFPKVEPGIRDEINLNFQERGLLWLQEEVKKNDPDYFEIVDKQNHQRLLRALEIYLSSGKPYSNYRKKALKERNFEILKIMLMDDRNILYQKIENRVDRMMENGLLDEVKSLIPYKNFNPLNTVGYKELFDYLDGKLNLEMAVSKIKQNSRRYAKRQITWFRNSANYITYSPSDLDKIIYHINSFSQQQY